METVDYEIDRALMEAGFGQRLVRLAAAWRREIDHELRPFDLTDATWRPVYYLTVLTPPVRQTDLARALSIEAPSLARLLDVLEKRGLVVRTTDEDDRRSKHIALTTNGQMIADTVTTAVKRVSSRLLASLSDDSLKLCHSVFDRVERQTRNYRGDDQTLSDMRVDTRSGRKS